MVQYGFKTLIMVDFLGNSKDDTHHKKETSASSAKEATSLPTNRFFGNVNVAGSTFPNLCRSSWHLQKPNKPSTEEKNDDRNHGCFFPGKWMVPKKTVTFCTTKSDGFNHIHYESVEGCTTSINGKLPWFLQVHKQILSQESHFRVS